MRSPFRSLFRRRPGVACRAAILPIVAVMMPAGARAAEALDGFWMDSDGEVILDIGPCGAARCGKVAWLKQPLGPDGLPLTDYRNPDEKLRNRPVCGLEVVSAFKKQDDGTWGGGTVYVSDHGMSFSGTAEVLSPTQVKVTGYIGIKLFGSSEVWTRVQGPPAKCLSAQGAAAPAPAVPVSKK